MTTGTAGPQLAGAAPAASVMVARLAVAAAWSAGLFSLVGNTIRTDAGDVGVQCARRASAMAAHGWISIVHSPGTPSVSHAGSPSRQLKRAGGRRPGRIDTEAAVAAHSTTQS